MGVMSGESSTAQHIARRGERFAQEYREPRCLDCRRSEASDRHAPSGSLLYARHRRELRQYLPWPHVGRHCDVPRARSLAPSAGAASLSLSVGSSAVLVGAIRLSGSSALCETRFSMVDRELCRAMDWQKQGER